MVYQPGHRLDASGGEQGVKSTAGESSQGILYPGRGKKRAPPGQAAPVGQLIHVAPEPEGHPEGGGSGGATVEPHGREQDESGVNPGLVHSVTECTPEEGWESVSRASVSLLAPMVSVRG